MTNLDLQLFKKSQEDGTVERYSLRVTLAFDEYGYNLSLPPGGFHGAVDSSGTNFIINLTATQSLESGEIGASCSHTRTNLREIEGILPSGAIESLEVKVTSLAKGNQSGSIALADAEEEEARPVPFINLAGQEN